ncbi:hypothetical protein Pelsub_P1041 [Pelolinea submarina]|uniref:Phosphoenolpyruvate carboxykinase n=2 Tax=Pelolinea submarina TaxID=913107 RepID=A0A347ZR83_9CHLR|nr:hypothetical protein DFR64_1524 [Pelolinea submarina]BBB47814.1 hypothetical protein Pelsub_P1041 [Pelolinea submarina]
MKKKNHAMENGSYHFYSDKFILRVSNRVCISSEELLTSEPFLKFYYSYLESLKRKQSPLLNIFSTKDYSEDEVKLLQETLYYLNSLQADKVAKLVDGSEIFFRDTLLFNEFIEQFYNYWRRMHRLVICDSVFDRMDQRPYRTFNDLVESLMHLVRSTYRNIQENITGKHPKIYRQVSAGAEIGAIALPMKLNYPNSSFSVLDDIFVIRQVLIYPPMIFNTPNNKRKGQFARIDRNPLDGIKLDPKEWLCYPARVGPLLIAIYFPLSFFELGFSLSNLFELADENDLQRKPDAVYIYGAPEETSLSVDGNETVFFDDEKNNIMVGSVPFKNEYAYFGYLKKMILTLHNIIRMKDGYLPFHGAMVQITMRNKKPFSVLIMGDSGAGKSESIEALRLIASDEIEDLMVVADDMGSIAVNEQGRLVGYGTEMGAFVRLDDLQSGYALGQIDRTIIMNPDQVNARVVMPVTRYEYIMAGTPIDCVLYANNYEAVDKDHPIIDRFANAKDALNVFRRGAVMSKGTTTTKGLVENYFANIFGPPQYHDLHEGLAQKYFQKMFDQNIYVGQMRTQLGIPGSEQTGPKQSATALLQMINEKAGDA